MSTTISTYCVVYGCRNKGSKKSNVSLTQSNIKITFHKFPNKQSALYKMWLNNINREHFIPKSKSVVCSMHFTADLIRPNGKLLGNAVPTLFMGGRPKHYKQLADKGIQCELGTETYRSQPGVKIVSTKIISHEVEEFGDENNPDSAMSVEKATSSSYSIDKALEQFSYVNVVKVESEEGVLISPDVDESFIDVKCILCTCGECVPINTESISNCCHQLGLDISATNGHKCIAHHEKFETVVLDIDVILTRLHTLITLCSPEDAEYCVLLRSTVDNRLCRHVAYHQFRSWINSQLSFGTNKIQLIPTCVINAVRQRFPEDDNIYKELFFEPNNGQENKFQYLD